MLKFMHSVDNITSSTSSREKIDTLKKKLKIVRFLKFVQILGLTHSSDSIHPNTSSCKKIDTLKKKTKNRPISQLSKKSSNQHILTIFYLLEPLIAKNSTRPIKKLKNVRFLNFQKILEFSYPSDSIHSSTPSREKTKNKGKKKQTISSSHHFEANRSYKRKRSVQKKREKGKEEKGEGQLKKNKKRRTSLIKKNVFFFRRKKDDTIRRLV